MKHRLRLTRLLLLPPVVLAIFSHHVYGEDSVLDTLLGAAGLVLLVAAMGGRIWASVHLVGRKNETLVTGGPYAIVRNPLYLFSLLGFVGAGLAFESLTLAMVFTMIFFACHWPAIQAEERHLKELFGDEYEGYRARVPRLVPRWGSFAKRKRASKGVLVDTPRFGAALRDCMAIPMIVVIADVLEWAKLAQVLPILVYLP